MSRRRSQFSRPAFFCRTFSWALLRANSCARQLRGFCFSGSALSIVWVPSIKHPLALGAAASRFRVPQENGARKVGVGIMITHNPLHGSGQAALPHPALTLGDDANAAQGIGMTDGRQRQPAGDETPHAVPKDAAVLAA